MCRISTHATIHGIKTIKARALQDTNSLILEFASDDWTGGSAEILLCLEDRKFTGALAAAINDAVAKRKAELLSCVDTEAA